MSSAVPNFKWRELVNAMDCADNEGALLEPAVFAWTTHTHGAAVKNDWKASGALPKPSWSWLSEQAQRIRRQSSGLV